MIRLFILENDRPFARRMAAELSVEHQAQCTCGDLDFYVGQIQTLRERGFDAVLLDWPGERENRFLLCAQLAEELGEVPLVVVAGEADPDELDRVVVSGADDIIVRGEFDAEFNLQRVQIATERSRVPVLCGPAEPWSSGSNANGLTVTGPTTVSKPPDQTNCFTPSSRLQLLHIDRTNAGHANLQPLLDGLPTLAAAVARESQFEEAVRRLETDSFDAVFMELDRPDIAALYTVESIRSRAPETPILLMTRMADPRFAILAIQRGADDYLDQDHVTSQFLARCLRLSIVRRRHRQQTESTATTTLARSQDTGRFPHLPTERRRGPRRFLTKTAVIIPFVAGGAPRQAFRTEGLTCDISDRGIGFEVGGLDQPPTSRALFGIEGDNGVIYFATIAITNQTDLPGRLRIGARFVQPEADLLRAANLMPTYRPESHSFATGLPTEILNQWVAVGIFRPVLVDRIYVCPRCGALPTLRSGCHSCGSIHIASHQLIHHVDCAYVGMVSEFEQGGEIVCPKCHARGLKSSIDVEYLNGPSHCLDCDWSDTDTEIVGQCLRCHWRFPLKQAAEKELIGYHANRLDPKVLPGARG